MQRPNDPVLRCVAAVLRTTTFCTFRPSTRTATLAGGEFTRWWWGQCGGLERRRNALPEREVNDLIFPLSRIADFYQEAQDQ